MSVPDGADHDFVLVSIPFPPALSISFCVYAVVFCEIPQCAVAACHVISSGKRVTHKSYPHENGVVIVVKGFSQSSNGDVEQHR